MMATVAQQQMRQTASAPVGLLAFASAVAVANIYYNQPMLADMARSVGVEAHQVGLVATATQVGYAAGMPLFIPLGDIVDRRKLVTGLFAAVACALLATGLASHLFLLIGASLCLGLTSIIAQILIPIASDLSPADRAGKTIGLMQSGVLLGILLARTVSGLVSHHFGWRAMFFSAAVVAAGMALLLRFSLPPMPPRPEVRYRAVMLSLVEMVVQLPKLRQVCFVAALFFAAFSAFWTTLVFFLETPPYHYGSQAAGLFGLIGAVGAGVAPLAGYWADRRGPRFVVSIAIAVVAAAFGVFWIWGTLLAGLILGVVVLDAGVQAAQVANQTRVMSLRPDARNRVNTIYMISYFTGGSLGSLAGASLWNGFGWSGVCATGLLCMALAALALLLRR
jgi:predicted MFS family arabinose efflux permease